MNELRWIIAAVAAIAIVGIYVASRVKRAQEDKRFWADHQLPDTDIQSDLPEEEEPNSFNDPIDDDLPHFSANGDDVAVAPAAKQPAGKTLTVIQYLVHPSGEFDGQAIYRCAQRAGLDFSQRNSLDCTDEATGQAVFGLASAVGNGEIPRGSLDHFSTEALVLYMELPGPWSGLKAYHHLLNAANEFVETFHAKVLDESRSTMTEQGMRLVQEKIAEFDALSGVGKSS